MADSIRNPIVPALAAEERAKAACPVPDETLTVPSKPASAAPEPYVPSERDRIKAIWQSAPFDIEAARKKDREELDAWLLENARQAKRDEDERLTKQYSRPSGR